MFPPAQARLLEEVVAAGNTATTAKAQADSLNAQLTQVRQHTVPYIPAWNGGCDNSRVHFAAKPGLVMCHEHATHHQQHDPGLLQWTICLGFSTMDF